MSSAKAQRLTYRSAGVDYAALDAGKRLALTEALATSSQLTQHGGQAVDASRGEPAFVFEAGGQTLAFVLEGLGTKSIIARLVHEQLGENRFADVAYDAVAAIVNDLCCVGAAPLVVNAYFATGSSDWYGHQDRQTSLLKGWRRACEDAGAAWGGGESPSLPELVNSQDIELAGSAVGLVPPGVEPILGQDLRSGDEIVFVDSSGIHANGASLARMIADPKQMPEVSEGYATLLSDGRRLGDALLDPSVSYASLVRELLKNSLPVHYLSHITGHGMLKLMRPSREFTYEIEQLSEVPPVLSFMAGQAKMTQAAAYSTFNMGTGFAIYCASGSGQEVIDLAESMDLTAHLAGKVKAGPRRVVLKPLDVTYETGEMDLNGRQAA